MAPTSLLRVSMYQSLRQVSRASHRPLQCRIANRTFTQTSLTRYPRKDSQDKDSIDASPTEYSKSGTDADAAHKSSAFDPSQTKPETEKNSSEGSDLDVSPANPEVSKQRDQTEGGAENSPSEGKRSGGGGQKKNGEI